MKLFKKLRLQSLFLTCAWLLTTTGVILLCLGGYHYLREPHQTLFAKSNQAQTASADTLNDGLSDSQASGVQTIVESEDARAPIVAKFLERHGSPMKPYDYYGKRLVEIADTYNLDFRLLPAIAMRESNLCKNTRADAPHNCLGFGIYAESSLDFDSYEAGFERAAKELRAYYVDGGRITVEQVGQKYASSKTWADGVNQFMAEMRYDDRALGKTLKQDDTSVVEFAQ